MNAPPPILSSMKTDGSRIMIHTADVRGKWMTWRRWTFAALILFYVAAPFIPVGGHPMIQLDVEHRCFYLFGGTFNAQDFWMVLLIALGSAFALLLVTAWHGRVWCGWACPQSVFLEGIYRPIERFFEGPRDRRMKLEKEPWTAATLARRIAKLATFLLVSLLIAHTATAIFVSPRELWLMIQEGPVRHNEAFLLTMGFTAVLMFNFTWFREQFCVVVCPYGRLQSVLHDKDSIVVAYDDVRGEPRGKFVRDASPDTKRGDCVDCKRCIHVCPTGIDIRNGLQMECLACNQCVDACDEVMLKLNRKPGLITFASPRQHTGEKPHVIRPRLFVYAALMTAAFGTLAVSLINRTPFEANVMRARGQNPFILDGDVVRDPFEVHVFNKSAKPSKYRFEIVSPVPADVTLRTTALELESLTDSFVPVLVSIDRQNLGKAVTVQLVVTEETSGFKKTLDVKFLAPFGFGPT